MYGRKAQASQEGWNLPEVMEEEIDGRPLPQAVTLPVTANGRIFPREDVDIWTLEAKAGDVIVCDAAANFASRSFNSRTRAALASVAAMSLRVVAAWYARLSTRLRCACAARSAALRPSRAATRAIPRSGWSSVLFVVASIAKKTSRIL